MKEVQTIHRAFGYIIFRNDVDPNVVSEDHGIVSSNVYNVEYPFSFDFTKEDFTRTRYNHIWLYTKGKVRSTNLDTGDYFERGVGYCTLEDPHPLGKHRVDFLEPTTFFCLGPEPNINRVPVMPRVSFFKLEEGLTHKIEKPTRLFFCGGVLNMDGINISTPSQVTVSEGSIFLAKKSCYGLIFE